MPRRCCEEKERLRQEFWDELVNSITVRHGVYEVEFAEVVHALTAEDRANAKVISKLERRSLRDVLADAISYCYLPTTRDEIDRIWDEELVPIGTVLGLLETPQAVTA